MARPMIQMGVGQLEELFSKSKADQRVLKQLELELQFRQVPRALALLENVQAALKDSTAGVQPGATSPAPAAVPTAIAPSKPTAAEPAASQGSLPFSAPAVSPAPAAPAIPVATRPTEASAPSAMPRSAAPAAPPVANPLPQISLEDACRILKVLPGDSWEQVELSRRKLVLRSHPEKLAGLSAAQANQARAEAKRVNDAYLVVAARRSGRQ